MILTIVGWFWIICGAIFLLLPVFFWLGALIFKAEVMFLKLLIITAIFLLIKGLFYLLAKTSDKIKNFIGDKSIAIFRGFALIYLCIGIFLVGFAA
ncbi:MAG: hypothetical protein K9L87_00750 [Candidatus Omnitrophica bacterium]|nr:hypothetical protein [Candidatus Omnitrophota bacterium]MCF7891656.1 hypothetical protein [Candidatus Omnitrophota bacterium]MCF7895707.1 hypothetical protein [Candidatus Omnitrophota bacterium]MCF7897277.1 hypothetical protein [Candidatus Omnitrophota bacterium]MCF7909312.1 hypothetical protein [Candidatus Omnitrophota bacterium]